VTQETLPALIETQSVAQDHGDVDNLVLTLAEAIDLYFNLPDGTFIGMPDYLYFVQNRIGSTDIKILASDTAEDWFYSSKDNPDREESERDDEYLFGRALHTIVLEGFDTFYERYVESPFDSYVPKAARDWKAEQARLGLTPLKPKTYKNVHSMGALVHTHPEIGKWIKGGLAEVTVLFTFDGIRMRARLDRLLTDQIIDLKSMGKHVMAKRVPLGISPDVYTCIRIIRDLGYSGQRHIYSRARVFMRDQIRNGLVFGANPRQLDWLKGLVDVETWGFTFLFFKKTSNNAKSPSAPVLTPIIRKMGDFTDLRGEKMLNKACDNYHRLREQWGTVPWARVNMAVEPDDVLFEEMFGRDDNAPAESADDDQDWDDDEEGSPTNAE